MNTDENITKVFHRNARLFFHTPVAIKKKYILQNAHTCCSFSHTEMNGDSHCQTLKISTPKVP